MLYHSRKGLATFDFHTKPMNLYNFFPLLFHRLDQLPNVVHCQGKQSLDVAAIETTVYTQGYPLELDRLISALIGSAPGLSE